MAVAAGWVDRPLRTVLSNLAGHFGHGNGPFHVAAHVAFPAPSASFPGDGLLQLALYTFLLVLLVRDRVPLLLPLLLGLGHFSSVQARTRGSEPRHDQCSRGVETRVDAKTEKHKPQEHDQVPASAYTVTGGGADAS